MRSPLCNCGSNDDKLEPVAERRQISSAEETARYSTEKQAELHRAVENRFRRTSQHEAGHAVAAAAWGRPIEYVTIGGAVPHCRYGVNDGNGSLGLSAFLTCSVAGTIAEGILDRRIAYPDYGTLAAFIRKARAGEAGDCDRCREALGLVLKLHGRCDAELVLFWRDHFLLTGRLFDRLSIRFALHRLAQALHARTLLWPSDIGALVDAGELERARRAVFKNTE
jgi:hypothetical protein